MEKNEISTSEAASFPGLESTAAPQVPQRHPFRHRALATSPKLSWVSEHLGTEWRQQNPGGYKTFDLNSQRAPLFHLPTTPQFRQQCILYKMPSPTQPRLPVTAAARKQGLGLSSGPTGRRKDVPRAPTDGLAAKPGGGLTPALFCLPLTLHHILSSRR